jgi:hypothetical protein
MIEDNMSELNNVSFDSDINDNRENTDPSSHASQSCQLMSGSLQILGNLTQKNNEHLFNAFQQKMKQAGDAAVKFMIHGVHSSGPRENGEQLPQWAKIFHHYFELKKSQLSKLVNQEQA